MDEIVKAIISSSPQLVFGLIIAAVCLILIWMLLRFMTTHDAAWTATAKLKAEEDNRLTIERDDKWMKFLELQREFDRKILEQLSSSISANTQQIVAAIVALTKQIHVNTRVVTDVLRSTQQQEVNMKEVAGLLEALTEKDDHLQSAL